MIEKIGNVIVDTTFWPGEEKYSDGPIEDELLQRLQSGEDEKQILINDDRYAVLYHLSRERENILSWYPFTKDMNVLEIGAGCGAITGLLAKQCGHVTSVDISLTRSRINAYRHRDADNLRLLVMNAQDLPEDPVYDVVTLIGVFEYSALFVQKDNPFLFLLEHYKKMLKPGGHLLIAIENQFGLKYLMGAREDHHWTLNEGLYDYPAGGARTFSRHSIDKLLQEAGFESRQFSAVYPDYKLPYHIISEDAPSSMQVEFTNMPDFGEFAFYSADIHRVMQTAFNRGLGIELANSFFICAGSSSVNLPYYVKYSSTRKDTFALRTELYHHDQVKKIPLCPNSSACKQLLTGKKLLHNALPSLSIAETENTDDLLFIEMIPGLSLTEIIHQENRENRNKHFYEYIQLCRGLLVQDTPVSFAQDEHFKTVYGCLNLPNMVCIAPAPVDLNLSNIIVNNGKWTVIDTEWVFDFAIPLNYVLWRSAYLYSEATGDSHADFLALAGITDKEIRYFHQMENAFSQYVFDISSPRSYNKRFYAKNTDQKDCIKLASMLEESKSLIKTLQSEKNIAWDQFQQREEKYNRELILRLQLEETNRQLSVENEERIRQLTVDNEELARQLEATEIDRTNAWNSFLDREERIRQLTVNNEELTRQLEATEIDRTNAWNSFLDREERIRQLTVNNEELTRQLEATEIDRTNAWNSFLDRDNQLSALKTKLITLEKSFIVRIIEKLKKI